RRLKSSLATTCASRGQGKSFTLSLTKTPKPSRPLPGKTPSPPSRAAPGARKRTCLEPGGAARHDCRLNLGDGLLAKLQFEIYWRDFVTRLGTLRLQVARARDQSFLPKGLERFQRRAKKS